MCNFLAEYRQKTLSCRLQKTRQLVAKAEKEQNGEITAALIENKAGLEPDEQFYGVHLIDDISMSDCRLVSTDSLEADGLVETLEGVYAGLKKSLSDGGASDDFERK